MSSGGNNFSFATKTSGAGRAQDKVVAAESNYLEVESPGRVTRDAIIPTSHS